MNRRARRSESPGHEVARATESDEYRSGPGSPEPPEPSLPPSPEPRPFIDDALAEPGLDGPEVREWVVGATEHGLRLDRALVGWVPEQSRSHLQALVEAGLVEVDGEVATASSRRLVVGQSVHVELQLPPAQQRFDAEPMALDIRYQDDHLLILNKPAGLVVHPAAGHWQGTLLNGLLALDARAADLPRAGIVHRLDKDTSGLMVVARTLPAMTGLVRAIAAREVRRAYRAVTTGAVPASLVLIDQPIGRDARSRIRMAVRTGGKPAQTEFELLAVRSLAIAVAHRERAKATAVATYSAVACRLRTGRTHQIRVHLADAGHPLVGDGLYGGRPALGLTRQALHAASLGLAHPVTGEWIEITADPPADFAAAWEWVTGTGIEPPTDASSDQVPDSPPDA